jgi:hypothetical protein
VASLPAGWFAFASGQEHGRRLLFHQWRCPVLKMGLFGGFGNFNAGIGMGAGRDILNRGRIGGFNRICHGRAIGLKALELMQRFIE